MACDMAMRHPTCTSKTNTEKERAFENTQCLKLEDRCTKRCPVFNVTSIYLYL